MSKGWKFGDVLRMNDQGDWWPNWDDGEEKMRIMFIEPETVIILRWPDGGVFSERGRSGDVFLRGPIGENWERADAEKR